MATGIRMSLSEFEQETQRETYREYGMAGWLERDIPPKDYLVGHWLHTTARCLLSGDTGIGKSMFGLELAFCAALGLPFLHWPAGRSCRAIYLDSEMGPEEVKERLRHLSERHGGPTDNLTVLALEDFPDAASLDTEEGQAWILSIVEAVGAELVVFDNLMTLVTGSLKDDETWKLVLPLAKQLSGRRVAQIWVHHTGHDASRFYGSRTIIWQMTAALHLEKVADLDAAIGFKLSFQKARGRRAETLSEYKDSTITFDGNEWDVTGQAPRNPLRGAIEQQFFDALVVAIDAHGDQLPNTTDYPRRRGLHVDRWKDECRRRGLLDPKSQAEQRSKDAERAYFNKYKNKLFERNVARQRDQWVWLCQPGETRPKPR